MICWTGLAQILVAQGDWYFVYEPQILVLLGTTGQLNSAVSVPGG
jgi:hypothetical protein